MLVENQLIFQIIGYFLLFISGAFIGSFLNVVSDRIISKESILFGRSHCTFCNKILGALELVPVFSFLIQKGKCLTCREKLSYYYPFSEILTGLLFVWSAYFNGVFTSASNLTWISFIYLTVFGCGYIVLLFTDLKY